MEVIKQLQENNNTLEQVAESLINYQSTIDSIIKPESTEQLKQPTQITTLGFRPKVKPSTDKYKNSFKSGRSLPPKN